MNLPKPWNECPHCGSQMINCRHCGKKFTPRDMSHIPERCPRCNNNWRVPYPPGMKSKYKSRTVLQH